MTTIVTPENLPIFEQWYQWNGHWLYPTREQALAVWLTRGIENLPDPC
jgi:hypothetical protein